MADRLIDTTWAGSTGDASLASNWSNGLPDDKSLTASADQTQTSVVFDKTSRFSITSGLGYIRATSELTVTGNFSDTEVVVVDGTTYTFQTVLTDVDGNVLIGGSAQASLTNLFNAINLTGTPGTDYAASMTIHPTFTSTNSDATQLMVAHKDGGTTGNGKTMTTDGANATWGATTPSAGGLNTATGVVRRPIFIDDYAGTIMTTGDRWTPIAAGPIYIEGTTTMTLFATLISTSRAVVDSPNYNKALDVVFVAGGVRPDLEIVRGRVQVSLTNTGTDIIPNIFISDPRGMSENLLITGTTSDTGVVCIVGPGTMTNNGANWTDVDVMGGQFVNKAGTVTTMRSTGLVIQETTDTMTVAYIMGGELDLTIGTAAKTVTDIYLGPLAELLSRRDIDNFTLHEIGKK